MAMNPEVKDQWVKALRSGEYEQTRNLLHRVDGGYCCLGVLSELAVQAGVIPPARREKDDPHAWYYGPDECILPLPVENWAGLNGSSESATVGQLMRLNDKGDSFAIIADVIEARL
jgi:hypothetical protein